MPLSCRARLRLVYVYLSIVVCVVLFLFWLFAHTNHVNTPLREGSAQRLAQFRDKDDVSNPGVVHLARNVTTTDSVQLITRTPPNTTSTTTINNTPTNNTQSGNNAPKHKTRTHMRTEIVRITPPASSTSQTTTSTITLHKSRSAHVHNTLNSTKQFAYLIQGARKISDQRLSVTDTRDVYWLTFAEEEREKSEFVLYRPGVTWTVGRNIILKLALARGVKYEYYIFLDDDVMNMIQGADPWGLFERWLLAKLPGVGYMTRSTSWHRLDNGDETRGVFNVDGNINAFHRSMLGYLLPYNPSLDASSWYYSQYIMNLQVATFFRGQNGRVGWNIPNFDDSNNKHSGSSIYRRGKMWSVPIEWFRKIIGNKILVRNVDWDTQTVDFSADTRILHNITACIPFNIQSSYAAIKRPKAKKSKSLTR